VTGTETPTRALAEDLVTFLLTNEPPPGLFRHDVFGDFTLPHWRVQTQGLDELLALRRAGHPSLGDVPRWRFDPIPAGFVIEFEERWCDAAGEWYSREMIRADVVDGSIAELSVYCSGDWDEARLALHAREVILARP
jgi:hypothetical protein